MSHSTPFCTHLPHAKALSAGPPCPRPPDTAPFPGAPARPRPPPREEGAQRSADPRRGRERRHGIRRQARGPHRLRRPLPTNRSQHAARSPSASSWGPPQAPAQRTTAWAVTASGKWAKPVPHRTGGLTLQGPKRLRREAAPGPGSGAAGRGGAGEPDPLAGSPHPGERLSEARGGVLACSRAVRPGPRAPWSPRGTQPAPGPPSASVRVRSVCRRRKQPGWCGSVGRAFACKLKGPGFESR